MELTTSLLLLLLSYLLFISSRRPPRFPPGLQRIPLIGQMFRGSKPYLGLWKAHKIMGHFIGSHPAVTIQDFQMAKDLFNKEEWCGRGLSIISRYFRSDNGINKVGARPVITPGNCLLSAGHHLLGRPAVAGAEKVRPQTPQGLRLRQGRPGGSHTGGGGGDCQTSRHISPARLQVTKTVIMTSLPTLSSG